MQKPPLPEVLAAKPLTCDGAMGTQLLARGMASGECGMLWNINRPADVAAVHADYRAAGCDMVTTNSFGGTRFALDLHGLGARSAELNLAAARLARSAAGEKGWVLGDVGPFGDFLEPAGDMTPDELREAFRVQIAALIAGGADAILIETMGDPAEAVTGVEAARLCSATMPVIVTYTFQKTAPGEYRTIMGTTAGDAVRRATAAGAEVVGTNCGTGLSLPDYVELAGQLVAAAGPAAVIVQPNAGSPQMENGRTLYKATPEEMAQAARELLDAGVRIVGGCCGTTPAHLAAMSHVVRSAGLAG